MVPSSGDLHVVRADFSDSAEDYHCTVRNTITGREERSPDFNLVITGKTKRKLYKNQMINHIYV